MAHAGAKPHRRREGREAALAQFGRYVGDTSGTFKATLQSVFEDEDGRVVGVHHNSAERDSKHLDTDCCIVFELKDGKIIDGREHFFDLYNWDEFWSKPPPGRSREPWGSRLRRRRTRRPLGLHD